MVCLGSRFSGFLGLGVSFCFGFMWLYVLALTTVFVGLVGVGSDQPWIPSETVPLPPIPVCSSVEFAYAWHEAMKLERCCYAQPSDHMCNLQMGLAIRLSSTKVKKRV